MAPRGPSLLGQVPGQVFVHVVRGLSAVFGARLEIVHQELLGVDVVLQKGLEKGEEHGRHRPAPDRSVPVVVLPPHDRVAQTALGFVVVHRNVRVVGEYREPVPVIAQALHDLPPGFMERGRIGELALHQFFHCGQRGSQRPIPLAEGARL